MAPRPPPKAPTRKLDYPDRRVLVFEDAWRKAKWLDAAASFDAIQPLVRSLAARFAVSRGPNDIEGQAIDITAFVRDSIRYVRDPNREEFSDASVVLSRGFGDCDDKARLLVALLRAVAIEARIRPVFNARGDFYHVQAEIRWPGSIMHSRSQIGGWILADPIIANLQLGDDPNAMPRDSLGRRILS